MLVKFKNRIINTDEIRDIQFRKYGWSCSKYNGAKQPLVTINLKDGTTLKESIYDEDIHEYKEFERTVLNKK